MTSEAPSRSAALRCATSFTLVRTAAPCPLAVQRALRGMVEQRGVPVVQHPRLRARQERSEPPHHRAGPAAEVVDDDGAGASIRAALPRAARERARPSASSRSVSHSTETGMTSLIAHPQASVATSLGGVAPPRQARPRAPRLGPHAARGAPGRRIHSSQCLAERRRLVRRHEHGGAGWRDRLGDPARRARDDRDAAPQRVGDGHAVALGA